MQQTANFLCPKGHASSEADYCSECGAKILGSDNPAVLDSAAQASATGHVCPDCGTVWEHNDVVFCEVCGYNFVTGAHGEIPVPQPAEPPADEGTPDAPEPPKASAPFPMVTSRWTATVSVDPALRRPESPEPPADVQPYEVLLDQPTNLIGRRNEARGIFPEIALAHDEAVSRRHALLQLDPDRGLLLRDIGAANGTRLNGQELQAMTDYPLHDGDEITLGHWSRIKLSSR